MKEAALRKQEAGDVIAKKQGALKRTQPKKAKKAKKHHKKDFYDRFDAYDRYSGWGDMGGHSNIDKIGDSADKHAKAGQHIEKAGDPVWGWSTRLAHQDGLEHNPQTLTNVDRSKKRSSKGRASSSLSSESSEEEELAKVTKRERRDKK